MLDAPSETALLIGELRGVYPAEQVLDIAGKLLGRRPLFHVELAIDLLANTVPAFYDYIRARCAESSAVEVVYMVLGKCMGYVPKVPIAEFASCCDARTLKVLRVLAKFVRQLYDWAASQADADFAALFPLNEKALSCYAGNKTSRFYEYLALEIENRRRIQQRQAEKRLRRQTKPHGAEKRKEEPDAFLLSSGTLRRAESQLMKKYGNLDASAQTASASVQEVADSQAVVESVFDRAAR